MTTPCTNTNETIIRIALGETMTMQFKTFGEMLLQYYTKHTESMALYNSMNIEPCFYDEIFESL